MARNFTQQALAALVDVMENAKEGSARVAAAREILDRGYGKALQTHEIDNITKRPTPELIADAKIALKELEGVKNE